MSLLCHRQDGAGVAGGLGFVRLELVEAPSISAEVSAGKSLRICLRVLGGCQSAAGCTVHAAGQFAVKGDAMHQARLVTVVVDRVVLSGAVVPDRQVAYLPVPAHRVFRSPDVAREQVDQHSAVFFWQTFDAMDVTAYQQAFLLCLRVNPHNRVFGADWINGDSSAVVGMHCPKRVGQGFERSRKILVCGSGIGPDGTSA